ncbi:hypothetical protein A6R68_09749, partial [Neotoma lepida]
HDHSDHNIMAVHPPNASLILVDDPQQQQPISEGNERQMVCVHVTLDSANNSNHLWRSLLCPGEDEIMGAANFQQFLQERINVDGEAGTLVG